MKKTMSAKQMNGLFRLIKPKRMLRSIFNNPPRHQGPLKATKWYRDKYELKNANVDGNELLTTIKDNTTSHLIYLHGGAYVMGKDGLKNRENIMSQLIENTPSKITFFDYPVAPEAQFRETLRGVRSSYDYLIENYPEDDFIFIGDSAGAGLALAFVQLISKEDIKQPKKLILLSPWLDVSMSHPDIDALESHDMILDKVALLEAGIKYAGLDNLKHPSVSPLYGDFSHICPTLLFIGTHELLYPDVLKLKDKVDQEGLDITFSIYPEMQHVWMLAPLKEGQEALDEIYDFIRKETK